MTIVFEAERCPIISAEGSMAVICLSVGSYEPAPAPTFKMVWTSPRAVLIL